WRRWRPLMQLDSSAGGDGQPPRLADVPSSATSLTPEPPEGASVEAARRLLTAAAELQSQLDSLEAALRSADAESSGAELSLTVGLALTSRIAAFRSALARFAVEPAEVDGVDSSTCPTLRRIRRLQADSAERRLVRLERRFAGLLLSRGALAAECRDADFNEAAGGLSERLSELLTLMLSVRALLAADGPALAEVRAAVEAAGELCESAADNLESAVIIDFQLAGRLRRARLIAAAVLVAALVAIVTLLAVLLAVRSSGNGALTPLNPYVNGNLKLSVQLVGNTFKSSDAELRAHNSCLHWPVKMRQCGGMSSAKPFGSLDSSESQLSPAELQSASSNRRLSCSSSFWPAFLPCVQLTSGSHLPRQQNTRTSRSRLQGRSQAGQRSQLTSVFLSLACFFLPFLPAFPAAGSSLFSLTASLASWGSASSRRVNAELGHLTGHRRGRTRTQDWQSSCWQRRHSQRPQPEQSRRLQSGQSFGGSLAETHSRRSQAGHFGASSGDMDFLAWSERSDSCRAHELRGRGPASPLQEGGVPAGEQRALHAQRGTAGVADNLVAAPAHGDEAVLDGGPADYIGCLHLGSDLHHGQARQLLDDHRAKHALIFFSAKYEFYQSKWLWLRVHQHLLLLQQFRRVRRQSLSQPSQIHDSSQGWQPGSRQLMPQLSQQGLISLHCGAVRPAVRQARSQLTLADNFFHFVKARIDANKFVIGQAVGPRRAGLSDHADADLPQHQAHAVHVSRFIRLKLVPVEAVSQQFRRHVALSANPSGLGRHLGRRFLPSNHGQAEIGYAAGQDVPGLHVPVCDGRLAVQAANLGVQIAEAGQGAQGQLKAQAGWQRRLPLKEVVQRAKRVVLGDQPELGAALPAGNVASPECQYTLVAKREAGVHLAFPTEAGLISGAEDLHGQTAAHRPWPTCRISLTCWATLRSNRNGTPRPLPDDRSKLAVRAELVSAVSVTHWLDSEAGSLGSAAAATAIGGPYDCCWNSSAKLTARATAIAATTASRAACSGVRKAAAPGDAAEALRPDACLVDAADGSLAVLPAWPISPMSKPLISIAEVRIAAAEHVLSAFAGLESAGFGSALHSVQLVMALGSVAEAAQLAAASCRVQLGVTAGGRGALACRAVPGISRLAGAQDHRGVAVAHGTGAILPTEEERSEEEALGGLPDIPSQSRLGRVVAVYSEANTTLDDPLQIDPDLELPFYPINNMARRNPTVHRDIKETVGTFSMEKDFNTFVDHFDLVCREYNLQNPEKAQLLPPLLQGTAREIYGKLDAATQQNYPALIIQLRAHFNRCGTNRSVLLHKLHNRRMQATESFLAFVDDIRQIIKALHQPPLQAADQPPLGAAELAARERQRLMDREQNLILHVINNAQPSLRDRLLRENIETEEDLLRCGMQWEASAPLMTTGNNEVQKLTQQLNKLMQHQTAAIAEQKRRNEQASARCYYCGQEGHYQINCPHWSTRYDKPRQIFNNQKPQKPWQQYQNRQQDMRRFGKDGRFGNDGRSEMTAASEIMATGHAMPAMPRYANAITYTPENEQQEQQVFTIDDLEMDFTVPELDISLIEKKTTHEDNTDNTEEANETEMIELKETTGDSRENRKKWMTNKTSTKDKEMKEEEECISYGNDHDCEVHDGTNGYRAEEGMQEELRAENLSSDSDQGYEIQWKDEEMEKEQMKEKPSSDSDECYEIRYKRNGEAYIQTVDYKAEKRYQTQWSETTETSEEATDEDTEITKEQSKSEAFRLNQPMEQPKEYDADMEDNEWQSQPMPAKTTARSKKWKNWLLWIIVILLIAVVAKATAMEKPMICPTDAHIQPMIYKIPTDIKCSYFKTNQTKPKKITIDLYKANIKKHRQLGISLQLQLSDCRYSKGWCPTPILRNEELYSLPLSPTYHQDYRWQIIRRGDSRYEEPSKSRQYFFAWEVEPEIDCKLQKYHTVEGGLLSNTFLAKSGDLALTFQKKPVEQKLKCKDTDKTLFISEQEIPVYVKDDDKQTFLAIINGTYQQQEQQNRRRRDIERPKLVSNRLLSAKITALDHNLHNQLNHLHRTLVQLTCKMHAINLNYARQNYYVNPTMTFRKITGMTNVLAVPIYEHLLIYKCTPIQHFNILPSNTSTTCYDKPRIEAFYEGKRIQGFLDTVHNIIVGTAIPRPCTTAANYYQLDNALHVIKTTGTTANVTEPEVIVDENYDMEDLKIRFNRTKYTPFADIQLDEITPGWTINDFLQAFITQRKMIHQLFTRKDKGTGTGRFPVLVSMDSAIKSFWTNSFWELLNGRGSLYQGFIFYGACIVWIVTAIFIISSIVRCFSQTCPRAKKTVNAIMQRTTTGSDNSLELTETAHCEVQGQPTLATRLYPSIPTTPTAPRIQPPNYQAEQHEPKWPENYVCTLHAEIGKAMAQVIVNNLPCRALLDSGSSITVISQQLCNKLRLAVRPAAIAVAGAGGHSLNILGKADIDLKIANKQLTVPTYIIDRLPNQDVIVGIDTFKQLQLPLTFDFNKQTFRIDTVEQPLINQIRVLPKVTLQQDVIIQPESACWVRAKTTSAADEAMIFDPHRRVTAKHQIMMPTALVLVAKDKQLPVQIFNPNTETVHLRQGMCIGHLNTQASVMLIEQATPRLTEEEFQKKINLDDSPITEQQKRKVRQLLWKYNEAFCHHDYDIGRAKDIKQEIKLLPHTEPIQMTLKIQDYNYKLVYKPGITNKAADALSRAYEVNAIHPIPNIKELVDETERDNFYQAVKDDDKNIKLSPMERKFLRKQRQHLTINKSRLYWMSDNKPRSTYHIRFGKQFSTSCTTTHSLDTCRPQRPSREWNNTTFGQLCTATSSSIATTAIHLQSIPKSTTMDCLSIDITGPLPPSCLQGIAYTYILTALDIFSNAIHRSTDNTPFFLMFGRDFQPPNLLAQQLLPSQYVEVPTSIQKFVTQLHLAWKIAKHNIDNQVALTTGNDARSTTLTAGDIVYLHYPPQQTHKHAQKYKGPYRVVQLTSPTTARLANVQDPHQHQFYVHIHRLKKINTDTATGTGAILPTEEERSEEEALGGLPDIPSQSRLGRVVAEIVVARRRAWEWVHMVSRFMPTLDNMIDGSPSGNRGDGNRLLLSLCSSLGQLISRFVPREVSVTWHPFNGQAAATMEKLSQVGKGRFDRNKFRTGATVPATGRHIDIFLDTQKVRGDNSSSSRCSAIWPGGSIGPDEHVRRMKEAQRPLSNLPAEVGRVTPARGGNQVNRDGHLLIQPVPWRECGLDRAHEILQVEPSELAQPLSNAAETRFVAQGNVFVPSQNIDRFIGADLALPGFIRPAAEAWRWRDRQQLSRWVIIGQAHDADKFIAEELFGAEVQCRKVCFGKQRVAIRDTEASGWIFAAQAFIDRPVARSAVSLQITWPEQGNRVVELVAPFLSNDTGSSGLGVGKGCDSISIFGVRHSYQPGHFSVVGRLLAALVPERRPDAFAISIRDRGSSSPGERISKASEIQVMASADLQWELIKRNSCFLVKRGRKAFSTEAGNLKCRNSFNSNGLIHRRTVGIEAPTAGKSGVVLVLRNQRQANRPARSHSRVPLQRQGPRGVLGSIKKILRQRRYRRDLELAALRRASAIMRGQRKIGGNVRDQAASANANEYAKLFNDWRKDRPNNPKPVRYIVPILAKVTEANPQSGLYAAVDDPVLVEPYIEGRFHKFNFNYGDVIDNTDSKTMQEFSHFSYAASGGKELVCDAQGVRTAGGYIMTDPAVHSEWPGQYGPTDLGKSGQIKFFETHNCACGEFPELLPQSAVDSASSGQTDDSVEIRQRLVNRQGGISISPGASNGNHREQTSDCCLVTTSPANSMILRVPTLSGHKLRIVNVSVAISILIPQDLINSALQIVIAHHRGGIVAVRVSPTAVVKQRLDQLGAVQPSVVIEIVQLKIIILLLLLLRARPGRIAQPDIAHVLGQVLGAVHTHGVLHAAWMPNSMTAAVAAEPVTNPYRKLLLSVLLRDRIRLRPNEPELFRAAWGCAVKSCSGGCTSSPVAACTALLIEASQQQLTMGNSGSKNKTVVPTAKLDRKIDGVQYTVEFELAPFDKGQCRYAFKGVYKGNVRWMLATVKQIPTGDKYEHAKVGDRILVEDFIQGIYEKFNSNGGWQSEEVAAIPTFSHFTYWFSESQFLVCDIQGVRTPTGYILTDPAVLSRQQGKFGPTDLGATGMAEFFMNHRCTSVCSEFPTPVFNQGKRINRGRRDRHHSTYTFMLGKQEQDANEYFKRRSDLPAITDIKRTTHARRDAPLNVAQTALITYCVLSILVTSSGIASSGLARVEQGGDAQLQWKEQADKHVVIVSVGVVIGVPSSGLARQKAAGLLSNSAHLSDQVGNRLSLRGGVGGHQQVAAQAGAVLAAEADPGFLIAAAVRAVQPADEGPSAGAKDGVAAGLCPCIAANLQMAARKQSLPSSRPVSQKAPQIAGLRRVNRFTRRRLWRQQPRRQFGAIVERIEVKAQLAKRAQHGEGAGPAGQGVARVARHAERAEGAPDRQAALANADVGQGSGGQAGQHAAADQVGAGPAVGQHGRFAVVDKDNLRRRQRCPASRPGRPDGGIPGRPHQPTASIGEADRHRPDRREPAAEAGAAAAGRQGRHGESAAGLGLRGFDYRRLSRACWWWRRRSSIARRRRGYGATTEAAPRRRASRPDWRVETTATWSRLTSSWKSDGRRCCSFFSAGVSSSCRGTSSCSVMLIISSDSKKCSRGLLSRRRHASAGLDDQDGFVNALLLHPVHVGLHVFNAQLGLVGKEHNHPVCWILLHIVNVNAAKQAASRIGCREFGIGQALPIFGQHGGDLLVAWTPGSGGDPEPAAVGSVPAASFVYFNTAHKVAQGWCMLRQWPSSRSSRKSASCSRRAARLASELDWAELDCCCLPPLLPAGSCPLTSTSPGLGNLAQHIVLLLGVDVALRGADPDRQPRHRAGKIATPAAPADDSADLCLCCRRISDSRWRNFDFSGVRQPNGAVGLKIIHLIVDNLWYALALFRSYSSSFCFTASARQVKAASSGGVDAETADISWRRSWSLFLEREPGSDVEV
uniref:PDZ domain-containing protein n=1 Tax=Macrostomum lignano TaxID=282301 RepID=A0A1I8GBC0_9PLAT